MISKEYVNIVKNSILFAISSFGSKVVAYMILPMYTSTLSEADYGILDLIVLTVNLIVPVVSFCISDWLLRETTEDLAKGKKTFSIALLVLMLGFIILLSISGVAVFFVEPKSIIIYIMLGYLFTAGEQVVSYMVRAIDKTFLISAAGITSALFTICFHTFCMKTNMLSLDSYFICQYSGIAISIVVFFVGAKLWKWIERPQIKKEDVSSIRKYCLPLMPNALFWWCNSSILQYIIVFCLGVSSSGIYAAAAKIPSLLTVVSSIFQQAWNLSLFQQKKDSDGKFEKSVFLLFHTGIVVVAFFIILMARLISSILLKGEFFNAWIYVPTLVSAFVFSSFSTFMGSYFTARKNTKLLFFTTMVAAMTNVILGCLFVPTLGLIGAAISILISSAVMYYMRLVTVIKLNYLKIKLGIMIYLLMSEIILVALSIFCYIDNLSYL